MFYTKYRPVNFSEIVATSNAPKALAKQVITGKTVHAYLFVGPRGIGKTTTARVLAKALNCTNLSEDGNPCNECVSCKAITSGSFLDLTEIDAASNRGIDDIRDLKSKVGLAPAYGKHKVYIIDEVHMLTKEAFNALLKTLEEPPEKVTFILCTTEANKVPDTIKSRCQTYKFKRASIPQLVDSLERIAVNEKFDISSEDLEKIASASLGGFRDAITLLQQVIEGDLDITSFSGLEGISGYHKFVDYLVKKDVPQALGLIREVFDDGIDLYIWTGELLKYLRDLMFIKSKAGDLASMKTGEIQKKMEKQVSSVDAVWIVSTLDKFIEAQEKVRDAFIPQVSLEIAVVEICTDLNKGVKVVSNPGDDSNSKPSVMDNMRPTEKKDTGTPDTSATLKVADLKKEPAVDTNTQVDVSKVIDITEVESKWETFLVELKKNNHSLLALIKNAKPLFVEGATLVIEVGYTFHKERLETGKNRKLVEQSLRACYGQNITIRCVISEDRAKQLNSGMAKALTDMNVMVPQDTGPVDKEALMTAFDGGLPLL